MTNPLRDSTPTTLKRLKEMIIKPKSTGTFDFSNPSTCRLLFSVLNRIAFLYKGTIKRILSKKDFSNKTSDNEILKFATKSLMEQYQPRKKYED